MCMRLCVVDEPLSFDIPFVSHDEFVWSKESITPLLNCYRFINFFSFPFLFLFHFRLILLRILFCLFAFLLSFYFIQFFYAVTPVQHALLNIYLVLRFVTQPIFRWHLVQSNDFYFVMLFVCVCVYVCDLWILNHIEHTMTRIDNESNSYLSFEWFDFCSFDRLYLHVDETFLGLSKLVIQMMEHSIQIIFIPTLLIDTANFLFDLIAISRWQMSTVLSRGIG